MYTKARRIRTGDRGTGRIDEITIKVSRVRQAFVAAGSCCAQARIWKLAAEAACGPRDE